jgi:hypothetical protein
MTSIHLTKTSQQHYIDELTCFLAITLTASAILAFNAIRKDDLKHERYAEYIFTISILGILGIILYISLYFWRTGGIPLT